MCYAIHTVGKRPIFSEYSGINAVLFYLTDIFNAANSSMDSGLSATLVTLVQVFATGAAVLLVERMGRKVLLMISGGVMAVSIAALGVYFYMMENKECSEAVIRDEFENLPDYPPNFFPPDFDLKDYCNKDLEDAVDCKCDGNFSQDTLDDFGWVKRNYQSFPH